MHVRRGDFIHKQHFHPLLPLEYYKAGVQETATKNSNCILVFSDDIDWCKQVFGGDRRIKYSTNKNPFVDMCAMSMCNNHIIGNSTFSWWGAWLNPNPTKIVVAPKGWFGLGYAHWTIKDLFPDSWIKL